MCTNPRTIRVPSSSYEIRRGDSPFKEVTVPCGKCFECLKAKQNSLSLRCAREAEYKGNCSFLTLTYNDNSLPIAQSLWLVDKLTGETFRVSDSEIIKDTKVSNVARASILGDFVSVANNIVRTYVHTIDVGSSEIEYQVRYTPSLYYNDVRLWLKSSRVAFERRFGKKMSNFTYCIVGEYGQRFSRRPHYHCLFFGISKTEIDFLAYRWSNHYHYGSFDLKYNIKSSDFGNVASYVGKYIAKGCFDNPEVINGSTIKSRTCSSKYLGLHLTDKELSNWRCFNYFGKYDLNWDPSDYSNELLSMIDKGLYYVIPGFKAKFKLPNSFINKIFGNEFKNGKVVRSGLSYAYQAFVRNKFLQTDEEQFKTFVSYYPSEDLAEAVVKFEQNKRSSLMAREKISRESVRKRLQRSAF